MKATFDQSMHLLALAKQQPHFSLEWLQDLYDSGILSDVLGVSEPKKLDRDAVRRILGHKTLNPPQPPLLEPVGTITVPALAGRFVAREKFVLNYGREAKPGVRLCYVDAELLDLIEEPAVEAALTYSRLARSSGDGQILASLGNRPDLAILLRQIYWLMEQQPNGEPGTLLSDSWANIFYMPGFTRVVYVYWYAGAGADGWCVNAYSVVHPYVGFQVFSRNSCAAVAV